MFAPSAAEELASIEARVLGILARGRSEIEAWEAIPLELYGAALPDDVGSSWMFVLRRGVFSAAETARLAADCEALAARIQASATGEKEIGGAYMFQRQWDTLVAVE